MLRRYLALFGAKVLWFAAACTLAATSACGDPTAARGGQGGTGALPRLVVDVTSPAGDTLAQLGVEFTARLRDSTRMTALTLYVDSSTSPNPVYRYRFGVSVGAPLPRLDGVAFAPADTGRHTFTLVATDTANRTASATFVRTFAIPDQAYVVAVLPDLGQGAGPVGLTAGGDVTGWVRSAPTGHRRPAVWRAGVLQQFPAVPDSGDVVAVRTNGAGDVLLQFPPRSSTAARVVRADGALLTLGPHAYAFNWPGSGPAAPCCTFAGDLSEGRIAVGASSASAHVNQSVLFDVARGTVVDSVGFGALVVNNAGRVAGGVQGDVAFLYDAEFALRTYGFPTPPSTPASYRYLGYCMIAHGLGLMQSKPVDLDDANALLLNDCGSGVYVPPGGSPTFVDRYVGVATQVHMSRQGGLIAALDTRSGAIRIWNTGTGRVTRLRAPGTWSFDTLAAVNARGQIAVLATDTAAPRQPQAALLLTPAR